MKARRLAIATVLGLLLAACGGNMNDLTAYIAEVKARPPQPIEPIPAVKPAETFLYEAAALRDPFRFEETVEETQTTASAGPRPDPNRRKEYLESFPLDTLKMVGTLEQDKKKWGLVQDLDGLVHRVAVDNYLGQNQGRIVMIAPDHIEIAELIPDGGGGWIQRDATISLTENG